MNRPLIPFKIKTIEPIKLLPRELRGKKIAEVGLNLFRLKSEDVYIDLLTDSGTGAMSTLQWSRAMLGDESYAGSNSFYKLEEIIQDITGLKYILPVHQGRAAEHILDRILIKEGGIVLGNTHFDTTKAHIEFQRGRAVDCTVDEGFSTTVDHPFKGNIDLNKLESAVKKYGHEKIAYVLLTVTCNSGGGQPVSMANIKEVSQFCRKNKILLFLDAARFAENAHFIKIREKDYEKRRIKDIAREIFSYADGCTMSAKKDGLVPIGGFLAVKDEGLFEQMKPFEILFEGFYTYGGMSGLDMECLAQGLKEVLDEEYLTHRIGQIAFLGKLLNDTNIPIVRPVGGHAVFIDGRLFFKNVPEDQFPSQLLAVELYKEGGIRAVEVGSCLAGRNPDTGENVRPALDLCRLTIPRRVYTKEHLEYVADVTATVYKEKRLLKKGLAFERETSGIRHFTSTFRYI